MTGGREIYATCAACHGKAGEGGVGRPLGAVLATFPDCSDHIEWIRLGTEQWKAQHGSTLVGREIEGVMPAFDTLSEEELGRIAMYERVRFGGGDLEEQRAACGLTAG